MSTILRTVAALVAAFLLASLAGPADAAAVHRSDEGGVVTETEFAALHGQATRTAAQAVMETTGTRLFRDSHTLVKLYDTDPSQSKVQITYLFDGHHWRLHRALWFGIWVP